MAQFSLPEQWWRVALTSIGDAVIATDTQGRIVFLNSVAEALTGWTLSQAERRPLEDVFVIVNETTRVRAENPVAKVLQSGYVVGLANHTILVSKDGQDFPIDDSAAPIRAEDGQLLGVVLIFRDIRERRRTELSQAYLAAIVESSDDAIIGKTLESKITSWNRGAEMVFGYSADEVIGRPINILIPQDRQDEETSILEKLKRGERIDHFETVRLRKDGSSITVSLSVSPIKDGSGRIIGAAKIARDMTDRKKAVEALQENERLFRTLADSAPVMVWVAGLDKLCKFFNQRWLSFTGRTMEQELGNGWAEGVHPEDLDRCLTIYTTSFDARNDFEMEYRLRRRDGEYRWIMDKGIPLFSPDAVFTGYIGSCIDITERKRLEVERERLLEREQEARARAEDASQIKDEFLATISHELRTPLTAVLGWATLLRAGTLDDFKTQQALETIERNAKAQAQLIEDLLDVSRIISGKLRLDVRAVMLAPVVESAITAIKPMAESKNIRLQVTLDPNAGPVSGDPGRLQQVIWNLLSNAIKFTPREGRVQIMLERINSHLEITVTDTGQGIHPDFLPFVFDRFRQADAATTRQHGGLGLGLAIVRHVVELHGGTVTADSAGENKGARFTVRLPLMVVRPREDEDRVHPGAETRRAAILARAPRLDGVRVLIVDDESDTRHLLRTVLEQCGADVREAESAEQGVNVSKEWKPSIIASDIGMPGEDGYEFIRKLREYERAKGIWTPAVALTAYARAEDRVRALSSGFQIHVAKPIDPVEFALVIASQLGRSS